MPPTRDPLTQLAPPDWLDRLAGLSWRFLVVSAAAAVIITVLITFDVVLLPFFLAILFACALRPVDRRLRRIGARPGLAATISLILLIVMVGAASTMVVSALVRESSSIASSLNRGAARATQAAVDADLLPADAKAGDTAGELAGTSARWLATGALQVGRVVVELGATLFLSLFITFFVLKDGPSMWRWAVSRLGGGSALFDRTGRQAFGALEGYVRGAVIVSLADAVFISLGAWALGVPFPQAIFVLTFLMGFIPYVGAFAAGAFAALLAIASGGMGDGVAMIVVVLVVQQLETNLLQPVIMGKATSLHPLVVALAAVAGGAVAGLLGVFVAVPLAAAAVAAMAALREGGFFDGEPLRHPGPAADAPVVDLRPDTSD